MGVLVAADEAIPARAVRDRLAEDGTDRAQSPISTELNRLTEKGVVERRREEYPGGFRYLYAPEAEFEDRYLSDHLSAIRDVLGAGSITTICERVRQRGDEGDSETDLDCQ